MLMHLLYSLGLLLVLSQQAWAWQIPPKAQTALDKAAQRKFIDARRLADQALEEKPGIVARYVLSIVQSEAEGNLPRALFLVRQAKTKLLGVERIDSLTEQGQKWHKKILLHELSVLGHLDRRQEQLEVLDQYDSMYEPKLTELRIWPMVKLGQFDAARRLGLTLLKHEEASVRQRAYNGLMAVEEEAGNRQASFDWGLKAIDAGSSRSCVIRTNTALGARRVFDFAQAIRIDLEALEAEQKDCPTSPYAQLAPVYLLSGDFQKCVSALKSLRKAPRSRRMALQNEMLIRSRFVELLFALGAFEPAWTRIEQIMDKPDRSGMVSYDMDLVELGNLLLGYVVGRARLVELEEKISVRPWNDGLTLWLDKIRLNLRLRSISQTVRKLASEGPHLVRLIRPYMYENMMWYSLPLVDMLGASVIEQAIKEGLSAESDLMEEARRILDAFRIEIAFQQGDLETVVTEGRSVISNLPSGTVLLKARLNALVADAMQRNGQGREAAERFSQVMNTFPTVLRLTDIRLPVQLVTSGTVDADALDALEGSSRFTIVQTSPFQLTLDGQNENTKVCLQGSKRFACEVINNTGTTEELMNKLDKFHSAAFAPPIELSQSDMSTLDGRAVQGDAQSVIDDLLDHGGKKNEP